MNMSGTKESGIFIRNAAVSSDSDGDNNFSDEMKSDREAVTIDV